MSQLPKIDNPQPRVADPIPARVYDAKYTTRLTIHAVPGRWEATARLHDFDYDANALDPNPNAYEQIDIDLTAEVQRSPLIAQVLGGVLQAVNALNQERHLLAQLAAAEKMLAGANKQMELAQQMPTRQQRIDWAQAWLDQAKAEEIDEADAEQVQDKAQNVADAEKALAEAEASDDSSRDQAIAMARALVEEATGVIAGLEAGLKQIRAGLGIEE